MTSNDLFDAVFENNVDVVLKGIKEHEFSPNEVHLGGGHTLLQSACQEDCLDTIKVLLDLGADPNQRLTRYDIGGRCIEKNAVALSSVLSVEAASLLLNKGAEINVVDDFGFTPLLRAASRRDKKVTNFLIEKGVNFKHKLNIKDKMLTPYDFIVSERDSFNEIFGNSINQKQKEFLKSYDEIIELLRIS